MYINNTSGNLIIGGSSPNAKLEVTQAALSSAWKPVFKSNAGGHTALTAATEFISQDFTGATWTWADGTVTTQRFNYFRGYTLNKTTTSTTFTDAYNVYIDDLTFGTGVTGRKFALGLGGKLALVSSPDNDEALTQVLVRDDSTGEVKYKTGGSSDETELALITSNYNYTQR